MYVCVWCGGRGLKEGPDQIQSQRVFAYTYKPVEIRDFTLGLKFEDIPTSIASKAADLVLDLLGVAAAAHPTDAARIARETAHSMFGPAPGAPVARLLFDGRPTSPVGAAYAGASQIDSFDAHDGHPLTKGHTGVAILPTLLAFAEVSPPCSGREALTCMVIGYELATRAAMALHATVSDYHTSGAWNALAAAAVGARLRGLSDEALRQAMGIAEYHGPRSQMMREIDNPSMLHDGSGWGALAGASATVLAEKGFTGAPAITVEGQDAKSFWTDLGTTWLIAEHYIKPYPVCRWAHAVIDGALAVRNKHNLVGDDVCAVEIATYLDAAKLATDMPKTTAKAQYSLAFPVAAAIQRGHVGVDEVMGSGFDDAGIARLVSATSVREEAAYNPPRARGRPSEVTLVLRDGRRISSGKVVPRGGPDDPLERAEVSAKFSDYATPLLGNDRVADIEHAVYALMEPGSQLDPLLALVLEPGH